MKELISQACFEIRDLRRRNELLESQLAIVDIFAAALGMKRRDNVMTVDIVWQLERELEKMPNVAADLS